MGKNRGLRNNRYMSIGRDRYWERGRERETEEDKCLFSLGNRKGTSWR